MSKPTDHHVSPYAFKSVFGFTPCNCHEAPKTAIYATYRVEYETESFSSMLKRITVTCEGCGAYRTKNVESEHLDGDSIYY